jgi:hypothetical protein
MGSLSLKENPMKLHIHEPKSPAPWNKDRLIGQKAPLKLNEVWAIRIRLQLADQVRHLALFNLAIDSKSRRCDWSAYGFAILPEVKRPAARHRHAAQKEPPGGAQACHQCR